MLGAIGLGAWMGYQEAC
ncbi:hypothetical protein [Parathermosynechococcus lividus]